MLSDNMLCDQIKLFDFFFCPGNFTHLLNLRFTFLHILNYNEIQYIVAFTQLWILYVPWTLTKPPKPSSTLRVMR
jgi:hypothetical protein